MKSKTILTPYSFLICIFLLMSCKEDNPLNPEFKINVTLKNAETYEYDFNIGGDEERVIIKKQAQHFEISKIIRDATTKWSAVYRYKPKASYIGNDYVLFETCTGGIGADCNNIEIVKIIFNVTE